MMLFSKETGVVCARWAFAGMATIAVAAIAGCGSTYRPVVTPINPTGPAAQPFSLVAVVSATKPTVPGTATILDYAGDDIMAQAPIGIGPKALAVNSLASYGYTVNSDQTITAFPISTSLQELGVLNTTLFTSTQLTGLYAPSTQLFAADLDGNAVDNLNGAPATFNYAIPVAPNPIAASGSTSGSSASRVFAISQNNSSTPTGSIIPYGLACNNSPANAPTVTVTGESDTIEVLTRTVTARIPLGVCPVFALPSADGNRMYVLNRGDDFITVINSQANTLNTCTCPAGGCLNQNGQAYTCHPRLPLSLAAVNNPVNGVTPINGTAGMQAVAGPVYAEFVPATNQLVVADYDGNTISVIDVRLDQYGNDSANFGATYTVKVGTNPASVTVLPDGSRAYTANQSDGTVTIVNLSSFTVEKTIPVIGHPRTVVSTANSLYGKVYVASPDSPLLTILRTDLDITDTTVLVPGNIVDVRVSSQSTTGGNSNTNTRMPGAGQPCYLPPSQQPPATTTLAECQSLPQ